MFGSRRMKITIMGTGTSHGVPVIACDCAVCTSSDVHDKRMRASVYITHQSTGRESDDGNAAAKGEIANAAAKLTAAKEDASIVIDTGPEFRMQCLMYGVKRVNAVLLTHSHADHLDGLDDVRIFSHTSSQGAFSSQGKETPGLGLPVYGNDTTLIDVTNRFDYIFKPTQLGGGKPKLRLCDCAQYNAQNPIYVGEVRVIPIPMMHGIVPTTGWLLSVLDSKGVYHSFAYLTDLNYIGEGSIKTILDNCGVLDTLVVDGLRERHHSTHFTYSEALECADKIGAHNTYLTHICHSASHEDITKWCGQHIKDYPHLMSIVKSGGVVAPAYDGQTIEVPSG